MIYVLTAIAVLLILIGILLFVNVSLKVKYDDKENVFRVALCYLWFTYVIAPEEETKKYKKALNKKGEAQKTEKKEKKKSLIKEKGVSGFLEDLKSIVKGVWTLLVSVLRRAVLKKLQINLVVAGEDAADTAVLYGYANAVVYPVVSAFVENVKEYKELDVSITPDFSEDADARICFELELKIRPVALISAVFECGESAKDLLAALTSKNKVK